MQLVKFAPALVTALVLSACSNNQLVTNPQPAQNVTSEVAIQVTQQVNDVASNGHGTAAVKVEKITDSSKSLVYRCQDRKQVTATYAFQGDEAKAVNLVLTDGKHSQKITALTRDMTTQDFTAFKSDKYVWNLDTGFTLSETNKSGMLTQIGVESDQILAKLCDVNQSLTSQLSK